MIRLPSILLALLAALTARSHAATNDFCAAGVAEFNAAHGDWDGPRFGAAVEWFRRATTSAPASSTHFYWLGVAEFHRLLWLEYSTGSRTNRAAIESARDAAVDSLEAAVKLNEADAESHALLGTLYGMKINGSLLRSARFGSRVAKHGKLALKHGAANPRVQYLLGTCRYYTAKKPAEWREALKAFQEAETLFDTEAKLPPGPLDARWGRPACLKYLGLTFEKLGQPDDAAESFRKALVLHPSDSVAREGLKRLGARQ